MTLYLATFMVEDDPASFDGEALVVASDRKEARAMAKVAAIEAYNEQAGGWSSKPKATIFSLRQHTLPEKGVVLTTGRYGR